MSTLPAETVSHTETIRSGPPKDVPYTLSENTDVIEFTLKTTQNQTAVIQPPESWPGGGPAPGWTPEQPVSLEDCEYEETQAYVFTVVEEENHPSEAFVSRIHGTVSICEGEGGTGGESTFAYDLKQEDGIYIDPDTQVTSVDTWVEVEAKSQETDELVPVEWEEDDNSENVTLSLQEEGSPLDENADPSSSIWFKADEAGSYTLTGTEPNSGNRNSGQVDVFELEILSTPMEIFASSKLDIPIAIKINGIDEVTINHFQDITVDFEIDDVSNEITLRTQREDPTLNDIVEGDFVENNENQDGVFTLLIPYNEYRNLMRGSQYQEQEIFESPKYKINIKLQLDESDEIELEGEKEISYFVKHTRKCVPYGKEMEFSAVDFESTNWNNADEGWMMFEPIEEDFRPAPFLDGINATLYTHQSNSIENHSFGPNTVSSFWLKVGISTDGGGGTQELIRAGVYDKRRGFYFVTYYGSQIVNDRNVIDISKIGDGMGFTVDGWKNSQYYVYWRGNDNQNTVSPVVIAMSTIGTFTSAFGIVSKTGPFLVAIQPIGLISFSFSAGALVAEVVTLMDNHEENLTVSIDNYLLINNEEGEFRDQSRASVVGNEGFSPVGEDSKTFDPLNEGSGMFEVNNQASSLFEVVNGVSTSSVSVDFQWEGFMWPTKSIVLELLFSGGDELIEITW